VPRTQDHLMHEVRKSDECECEYAEYIVDTRAKQEYKRDVKIKRPCAMHGSKALYKQAIHDAACAGDGAGGANASRTVAGPGPPTPAVGERNAAKLGWLLPCIVVKSPAA